MLDLEEKIIHSSALGGFLCAEVAWHLTIFAKASMFTWETWMDIAGLFWFIAFAAFFWRKRSHILQYDVQGVPPLYFFVLGVPMFIYAAITPWLLLALLHAIRSPVLT